MKEETDIQGLYPYDEYVNERYWFLLAKVLLANFKKAVNS
jgi:hypothetical protein